MTEVDRRGMSWWCRRLVAVLLWLAGSTLAPADEPLDLPRALTSLERLAPARLKAAHDDVVRIASTRHDLPSLPGLHDFRAILHAHADDSSHTGGTRPEMLAEAKREGVNAILLTDHYRPPRDFINTSWRGLRDGVLFVPGSEVRGFLIYPGHSIMDRMDQPTPAFIETVRADGGLIFLSHIEERSDHSMAGLDGMEIYNRHFDAIKDSAGLLALVMRVTDPKSLAELQEGLRLYPDEVFAFQVTYPAEYMAKWDRETLTRRLTGVAANDCHHNMVILVKMVDDATVLVGTNVDSDKDMRTVKATLRPGLRAMTRGHKAGDIVARVDLDPYHRSFRNVSTHVLAPALDEPTIRTALRAGHAYVSHDWMCAPTGFRFELRGEPGNSGAVMGDQAAFAPGATLEARFPAPCRIRLLSGGKTVAEARSDRLEHKVPAPGVYRVEGWLELGGEQRPWIYSNPIYLK
jgi:hypothetical protein